MGVQGVGGWWVGGGVHFRLGWGWWGPGWVGVVGVQHVGVWGWVGVEGSRLEGSGGGRDPGVGG